MNETPVLTVIHRHGTAGRHVLPLGIVTQERGWYFPYATAGAFSMNMNTISIPSAGQRGSLLGMYRDIDDATAAIRGACGVTK